MLEKTSPGSLETRVPDAITNPHEESAKEPSVGRRVGGTA